MKNLIIIVGTMMLGVILFNLIAGDEDSLRSASAEKIGEVISWYEEVSH